MLIDGKYKIECDDLNFTIFKKETTKAEGKVYWRPISYFSTLQNALDEIVDMGIAETGLKDFKTVIEKQTELYNLIRSLATSPEMLQLVRNSGKRESNDIGRATSAKLQKPLFKISQ